MMNTWKRRALALLSVPLLALPSAGGVYLWLEPHIGPFFASLTAAGFELLYIGVNLLIITTPELRRYARNVALSGVATAIIFNTLARYQAMVCPPLSAEQIAVGIVSSCTMRKEAFDLLALALAVLESIPLAGLAYAMSVLLHRLSDAGVLLRRLHPQRRAKLARLLRRLRSVARDAAQARASAEASSAMLAVARADLALARAELREQHETGAQLLLDVERARTDAARATDEAAQLRDTVARMGSEAARLGTGAAQARAELEAAHADRLQAQHASAQHHATATRLQEQTEQLSRELREYEQTTAQLREELAIARAATNLDLLAIARRFLKAEVPLREIAPLVGIAESTLRGRLKAATNGHLATVLED